MHRTDRDTNSKRRRSLIQSAEAAKRLGVSQSTFQRFRKNGKHVPGVHFVMVKKEPWYFWPALYELHRPR